MLSHYLHVLGLLDKKPYKQLSPENLFPNIYHFGVILWHKVFLRSYYNMGEALCYVASLWSSSSCSVYCDLTGGAATL